MVHQLNSSNGINKPSKVYEILKMLEETKEQIILSENKDVILLLGDTGSGKSTLAHFIGKDNKTLTSIKISAGQYLLIDDVGKISKQTTISETIIPQLVEDINTFTLYDCPGFHDTRNTATDIVNAFSIHTIMEHANKFKIIFVINYHSVNCGVERRSFIELMKNASKIIKNIQNYEKSIAAVITKVDNISERNGSGYQLISDHDVLMGIENFLNKVKLEISKEKSYFNTAIKLINMLLEKNGKEYKRLAIMRRPDEEGLISENELLQTERKIIHKILNENIIFTKKTDMDFGYTISDESKNDIFYLVEEINNNITKSIKLIDNEIIKNYKIYENNDNDFNTKIDHFNQAHLKFKNLKINIENKNINFSNIVEMIKEILTDLNINISQKYFDMILNDEYNLKFLSKVSERILQPKSIELISGIEPLLQYFNESRNWYIFLSGLYVKLTEYDIQKDTSKLNINDLQTLYSSWIQQKIEKIGSDFKSLFEHIYKTEICNGELIRNYSSIENIQVDDIKLRKLLKILIYTLENDVKYKNIDSTKIRIKGKFITLSKVAHKILSPDIKSIEIFGANKVFIDEDINFIGEKKKIFIAAPELDIINTREIHLDGVAALPYEELEAKDGEDGLPGLPGGIAGTFFGVTHQCFNSDSLTITANGGNGGLGQNGGRGSKGSDGEDPRLPDMEWFTGRGAKGEDILKLSPYDYKNISEGDEQTIIEAAGSVVNNVQGVGEKVIKGKFDISLDSLKKSFESLGASITKMPERMVRAGRDISHLDMKDIKALLNVWDETLFEIYGTNGEEGTKGGNGGAGGLGGKCGKINLYTLKNILKRLGYKSENGEQGNGGKGGPGGYGGVHGNCLTAKFINYKTPMASKGVPMIPAQTAGLCVDFILPSAWSEECRTPRGSADKGKPGIDSGNLIGQVEPEKDEMKIDRLADILQEYITYLSENSENYIKRDLILEFIEKLMNHIEITNIY